MGKNYKVGWVIPNQILACTYLTENIMPGSFMEIIDVIEPYIESAETPLSLIIDNRLLNQSFLTPLSQLQRNMPFLSGENINWVLVVKPASLKINVDQIPFELNNDVKLKHVADTKSAIKFLNIEEQGYSWEAIDDDFFPTQEVA